ncbi:methylmalonic aciduria and homocystinuria type D homolog, mitochondrial-like [Drosophila guanche]|uniref:methylmalonic aciduria and homocystinuria type D homolog, mitochondrial-like n=1 Tax=Drosophila guanche TaxID=7266 RepID=UPI001471D424|nr:methylmalonic aciduria and homocystinuria type D homolog, mitochondrial-like [Drosophila guanche]
MTLTSQELLKELSTEKPIPNIDMFLADDRQILQCNAHECPVLMVQDFQELFPNNPELSQGMTVMTISQKSINDMSSWSSKVIDERESLMEKFVFTAERMCNYLKSLGYWADFIDPSSGRPYNGDYTPATFFETDERYRKFGFEIEDLGCCKVISHSKWGTNLFVGALFTNAPVESDAIQSLIIYMDE